MRVLASTLDCVSGHASSTNQRARGSPSCQPGSCAAIVHHSSSRTGTRSKQNKFNLGLLSLLGVVHAVPAAVVIVPFVARVMRLLCVYGNSNREQREYSRVKWGVNHHRSSIEVQDRTKVGSHCLPPVSSTARLLHQCTLQSQTCRDWCAGRARNTCSFLRLVARQQIEPGPNDNKQPAYLCYGQAIVLVFDGISNSAALDQGRETTNHQRGHQHRSILHPQPDHPSSTVATRTSQNPITTTCTTFANKQAFQCAHRTFKTTCCGGGCTFDSNNLLDLVQL
jgi:hypothetical protein